MGMVAYIMNMHSYSNSYTNRLGLARLMIVDKTMRSTSRYNVMLPSSVTLDGAPEGSARRLGVRPCQPSCTP